MKRRVQRPLADVELVPRELLNPRADPPPVERLHGERLEDQQIQCSLHDVERLGHHGNLSPSAACTVRVVAPVLSTRERYHRSASRRRDSKATHPQTTLSVAI